MLKQPLPVERINPRLRIKSNLMGVAWFDNARIFGVFVDTRNAQLI